jgi:hypothetical protein
MSITIYALLQLVAVPKRHPGKISWLRRRVDRIFFRFSPAPSDARPYINCNCIRSDREDFFRRAQMDPFSEYGIRKD